MHDLDVKPAENIDARPVVFVTREASFSAAHCMASSELSLQENKALFGKCSSLHGHNYKVFFTVRGHIDPKTGMVLNLTELQRCIERVVMPLDHSNLQDVEYFHKMVSTAENLVVYLFNKLAPELVNEDYELYNVKLYETDKNSASFPHFQ